MSPEELAEILYEKYCNLFEDKYKVDPKFIAIAEQVVVIENELENCDGKFISDGNGVYLIMINKNLKEETSKRFTIAHELGHFEISKHRSVLQHGFNVFSFKLNYNPTSFQEKEANEFAASLLMPKKLFREFTDQLEINSQTIKKIVINLMFL
jgi:Predicted Zn peptidase